MGHHWWAPLGFSAMGLDSPLGSSAMELSSPLGSSAMELSSPLASGCRRTVPRSRRGSGTVHSSSRSTRAWPSQCRLLGPMARVSALRCRAALPRSVMAQRSPGPPSAR